METKYLYFLQLLEDRIKQKIINRFILSGENMSSIYKDFTRLKIVKIGNVKIGCMPGECPTLLVGTIFYHGDKLFLNEEEGLFDKSKAKEVIEYSMNYALERGLYFGLDVVFPSIKSIDNILPFVAEYNIPLFLDSPDPEVRVKAYEVANQLGVNEYSIANGIYTNSGDRELQAIKENNIETALLLVFDPASPATSMKPVDRVNILEEKLLPLAEKAGVKNILADAIVLDPASIVLSAKTIYLIKKKHGFPSGCAPANALGPVNKKNLSIDDVYGVHGGAAALVRLYGADFIMYGPVKRIKYIASTIALIDSLLGYGYRMDGVKIGRDHPLTKYLRKIQKLFVKY